MTYLSFNLIWIINIAVLCNLQFSLRDIRCVATTLTDSNCTANWVTHTAGQFSNGGRLHSGVRTLTECQKVCEFDPRCVAADFFSQQCWITTDPDHGHYPHHHHGRHYHLVSRCNITSGQWFQHYSYVHTTPQVQYIAYVNEIQSSSLSLRSTTMCSTLRSMRTINIPASI